MIRSLLVCLAVSGLTACATPTRTGPPAPIVSTSEPPPAVAPKPKPPAPKPESVSVYAYKAPSATAEGPLPEAPTAPNASQTGKGKAPATSGAKTQTTEGPPATQVANAPPIQVPDVAEVPELPAAASGLMHQAEKQRQTGDYAGAAASLERSLRISPQSAYLWNRLARVRLEQGMLSQAGSLAARSNALAGDQAKLKQDNWAIIAVARRSSGDVAGATAAERLSRGG